MNLTKNEAKVVDYLSRNKFVQIKDLERIGVARPFYVLRGLLKKELIVKVEPGVYVSKY